MTELRTSFVINLAGNLQTRARQYSQSIGRFAREGNRHLNVMNRTARLASRGLDRLGNRYTALLSGAGIGASIRQVGNYNDRLLQMATQAGIADGELQKLKKTIFDTAQDQEIRVDPTELVSALEAIVEKTGDLDFASKNIRNIGLAIRATGAAGQDIGEIMAEFQKMGIWKPDEVLEAIDILNVQGKEGAFTLRNIAALGPRVITAYTAAGRSGTGALREMGAVLQMIRMGTGSSEMAATAFEAVMRSLSDPQKIKDLEKLAGIKVWENLEDGSTRIRPIQELMGEIIKAAGGDTVKLGQVFDAEAVRAFNAAASEFKRTGQLEKLEHFYNLHADGTSTMRDAARMSKGFSASMATLRSAWLQFADGNLAEPIREFAEWLNSVDQETVQNWLNIAKYIGIAGAGLVIASKGVALIANMRRAFGKGGAAGAAGGLAGSITPVPVYIVNGRGAMPGGPDASKNKGRKPGRSRAGRFLSRAGTALGGLVAGSGVAIKAGYTALAGTAAGSAALVGGAGVAGYGAGTVLNKAFIEGTSFGDSIGRAIANGMAALGNDEARASLDREARYEAMQGELQISVSDDRVRVRRMRSRGMDMGVETGRMMGDGS